MRYDGRICFLFRPRFDVVSPQDRNEKNNILKKCSYNLKSRSAADCNVYITDIMKQASVKDCCVLVSQTIFLKIYCKPLCRLF